MEDARTDGAAATPGAADSHADTSAGLRFLDRFLPVEERLDACWIAGVAAALGTFRAVAYHPLQVFVSHHVASPGADEFGFALRATAIADAAWVLVVGLLAWALFRFTRAPKAVALYLVLVGVLLGAVSLGNRLGLDTVMVLASSEYHRSLWSDLQPMMLALAESVGIVLGAWLAHVMSGAAGGEGSGTLLPALGLEGRPLRGVALLAAALVLARLVGLLAATLLTFGPEAYRIAWVARSAGDSVRGDGLVNLVSFAGPVLVYFLVGYVGVRQFGVPRSVWLVFLAPVVPMVVATLQSLPAALAADPSAAGSWAFSVGLSGLMGGLPAFLGVWLATRPARLSVSSDTLPAEDHDHW
jgi:hypothetical protein